MVTEKLMIMTLFRDDGLPLALNHWAAMFEGDSVQAFQDYLANKFNFYIDTAVKVGFRTGHPAPTPMDLGLGRTFEASDNAAEVSASPSVGQSTPSNNFLQFGGGRPRRSDGRDGNRIFTNRGRDRGRGNYFNSGRRRGGYSNSSGASGATFRPVQSNRPF